MPYANDKHEMTIAPGCPWYQAQQELGPPNVNWCEPTRCAWINEPANTWSNLGFLLVGIFLVKKLQERELSVFGWLILAMGFFSSVYHATNNYFTQMLDFVGMFLMMSFLFAFQLKRFKTSSRFSFFAVFWFFMFLNCFVFLSFGIFNWPVQWIMLINALPIISLDLVAGLRDRLLRHYHFLVLSGLSLAVAQTFAIIDIQRIYCEPSNLWLHGHVLWHLFSAVAMLFAGLHMQKIQALRTS